MKPLSGTLIIDGNEYQFKLSGAKLHPNPENFEEITKLHNKSTQIARYLNDKLMMAPAEDSPQNIVNALIDDCLLQIFNELKAYDLCNVLWHQRRLCAQIHLTAEAS